MLLKDHHITIRNATLQDATLLASWWNDGTIMAHAGFPQGIHTNPLQVQQQLIHEDRRHKKRLIISYDHQPIGEMCYFPCYKNAVEIGIKICQLSYQNKGIGPLALKMLIQALFHQGYQYIVLTSESDNQRAHHVYEKKLGFFKKGVYQNAWKDPSGRPHTIVLYELTSERFHQHCLSQNETV